MPLAPYPLVAQEYFAMRDDNLLNLWDSGMSFESQFTSIQAEYMQVSSLVCLARVRVSVPFVRPGFLELSEYLACLKAMSTRTSHRMHSEMTGVTPVNPTR